MHYDVAIVSFFFSFVSAARLGRSEGEIMNIFFVMLLATIGSLFYGAGFLSLQVLSLLVFSVAVYGNKFTTPSKHKVSTASLVKPLLSPSTYKTIATKSKPIVQDLQAFKEAIKTQDTTETSQNPAPEHKKAKNKPKTTPPKTTTEKQEPKPHFEPFQPDKITLQKDKRPSPFG